MNGHAKSGVVYRHFYNWFLWKVAAPFGFLLFVWFAYSLRREMPHSFSEAFAHGELLIFAALVLIEVSFEGEELRGIPKDRFEPWFDGALPVLRFVAFMIIYAFGFIRYDVVSVRMQIDQGVKDNLLPHKLGAYAMLNLSTAVACVLVAAFSCVKHCEHELQVQLESLTNS